MIKGIFTAPLEDFVHKQLYALLKHFIAVLVRGTTMSPSIMSSEDPN